MGTLAVVIGLLPLAASAATITVNTTADNITGGDGRCTLREALANVDAVSETTGGDCAAGSGTGDTVVFDLPLPATIKLAAPRYGELVITQNVTIVGPGPNLLAIDGRHRTRVFHIIFSSGSAISNLTVQNGASKLPYTAAGGGILVEFEAVLDITNCTLRGNTAATTYSTISDAVGGGIAIFGTATLTNCTLSGNTAKGGIRARGTGGGMSVGPNGDGIVTLTNCTFSGNTAKGGTGGIGGALDNHGTATLTNCTFSGNTANGSGRGYDDLGGKGGGIYNGHALRLTNCTLSGNTATSRGRLAVAYGGGIGTDNIGPGIAFTLTNCLLSSNVGGSCTVGGGIDGVHNLDDDGSCGFVNPGDVSKVAANLAPLGDYGGPTQTIALCTGPGAPNAACTAASPAIDAGDDSVTGPPDNLTTDQRSLARLSGAHVDIGAYEVQ